MKRISYLLIVQAILSLASGYLISKMSWIGRLGISWMMPQYRIFKSWWQTAILLFVIQLLLTGILWQVNMRLDKRKALIVNLVALLTGIIGLYLTYNDFQTTFTHRLMKEKFHLGFYLFWLGWIGTTIGFMTWAGTLSREQEGSIPTV